MALVSLLAEGYPVALAWALAAGLAFKLQDVCRRQALGWTIDEQGERQKITHRNRDQVIFIPTSRDQRIVAEALHTEDRRKKLLWTGLPGWGLAGAAFYVRYTNYLDYELLARPLFWGLAGLSGIFLLIWFWHLSVETLYQSGWQDMVGAKVLDEPPPQTGLQDVLEQKAHGDARPATETETLSAAVGSSRKSAIHDQEF